MDWVNDISKITKDTHGVAAELILKADEAAKFNANIIREYLYTAAGFGCGVHRPDLGFIANPHLSVRSGSSTEYEKDGNTKCAGTRYDACWSWDIDGHNPSDLVSRWSSYYHGYAKNLFVITTEIGVAHQKCGDSIEMKFGSVYVFGDAPEGKKNLLERTYVTTNGIVEKWTSNNTQTVAATVKHIEDARRMIDIDYRLVSILSRGE